MKTQAEIIRIKKDAEDDIKFREEQATLNAQKRYEDQIKKKEEDIEIAMAYARYEA